MDSAILCKRKEILKNALCLLSLCVLLFLPDKLNAQLADTTRIIIANGWIEKMDNNIALNVMLNNSYETFFVDANNQDISLYPNISKNISLGVHYRFISISIQFSPDFLPGNGDDDIYGSTKSLSFGLSTIFSHWTVGANYTQVQGYFLENTSDFDPIWEPGDPFITFPELRYRGGRLTVGYNFNPKASLKAITTFTERQLKSSGSFILGSNTRYYFIDNKPASPTGQISSNWDFSVGPGCFYNHVWKEKYFAAIAGAVGGGFVHSTITTSISSGDDIKTYQTDPSFRWEGKAGLGYNNRDFFAGAYATVSGLYFNQQGTTAVNRDLQVYYQVIIGIRLAAPKWLAKEMNTLTDKIKL